MAFLKRMFSSDYRRAVTAEAAGQFEEAAKAYALAGEREKVAEMHLRAAERSGPTGRLSSLRQALSYADGAGEPARLLRRSIARAVRASVTAPSLRARHDGRETAGKAHDGDRDDTGGDDLGSAGEDGPDDALLDGGSDGDRFDAALSNDDRALLREAAGLLDAAGEPGEAARCLERCGDEGAAIERYQRAGDVARLERLLALQEARRHRGASRHDAIEEHRLHDAAGARDLALERLRAYCRESGDEPSRRMLAAYQARLLTAGTVAVRIEPSGERHFYGGRFPIGFGREEGCEVRLRDGGVSRRHAEVTHHDGAFHLRDCGSRNGTTLSGVIIDGELRLDGEGEIGVGDQCTLRFHSDGALLSLKIVGGIDRGLLLHLSPAPFSIAAGDHPAAILSFVDGRPFVEAAPGWSLRLNGARAARAQLLLDDRLELIGRSDERLRLDVVR